MSGDNADDNHAIVMHDFWRVGYLFGTPASFTIFFLLSMSILLVLIFFSATKLELSFLWTGVLVFLFISVGLIFYIRVRIETGRDPRWWDFFVQRISSPHVYGAKFIARQNYL